MGYRNVQAHRDIQNIGQTFADIPFPELLFHCVTLRCFLTSLRPYLQPLWPILCILVFSAVLYIVFRRRPMLHGSTICNVTFPLYF